MMQLGRLDVAKALGASIGEPQIIGSSSDRSASIPRYVASLPRTNQTRLKTFGKEEAAQIDDGSGNATFAELLVMDRLRADNWSCLWLSSFGRARRILAWPHDSEEPIEGQLPPSIEAKLNDIAKHRRGAATRNYSFAGIADVVAWRNNDLLLIECKRKGKDRLSRSQEEWFQCALQAGLANDQLGVFEWSFIAPTQLDTRAP